MIHVPQRRQRALNPALSGETRYSLRQPSQYIRIQGSSSGSGSGGGGSAALAGGSGSSSSASEVGGSGGEGSVSGIKGGLASSSEAGGSSRSSDSPAASVEDFGETADSAAARAAPAVSFSRSTMPGGPSGTSSKKNIRIAGG